MIQVCELIKELSSNRIVFVATHDRELMDCCVLANGNIK